MGTTGTPIVTSTLAPTSELDAVNEMLLAVGYEEVTALDGTVPDATMAQKILHRVSRAVQTTGWWFNTIVLTLSPNGDNEIPLTDAYLQVDPTDRLSLVREFQRKLFDTENQTFEFDADIEVEAIMFLAFEDIPQVARNYIQMKATRVFAKRLVASEAMDALTKEDEDAARAELVAADIMAGDYSIFDNYDAARPIARFRNP